MRRKFRFTQFFKKHAVNDPLCRKPGESGQGLVELAVSLIVILVLLAGIVDISRTITTKMQLQDAAEEGVVYAMAFPKNCTQIQYRVLDNLAKVKNAALTDIVVTYNNVACTTATGELKGQLIKVSISNSFPVSMPFIGEFIGNIHNLQVEAKGIVIKTN